MMKTMFWVGLGLGVSACASSSVTRLSQNTAMILTNTDAGCGTSGAAQVVQQEAALATLRAGYERFLIVDMGVENNTAVVSSGPSFARSTFQSSGGSGYGTVATTFGGATTTLAGTNDAQARIVMLNKGDPDYARGLDARTILGPKWQKKLDKGITSCFDD